jgi:hypothetical protein
MCCCLPKSALIPAVLFRIAKFEGEEGQTKPVGQYSLHSRAILAYYKNKWDKFCQFRGKFCPFCGKYAI